MNKSGIGVGSASIVLVFAVLCLTIFSLITFVVASNDKALVDVKVELVTGYYEADALAERILIDIFTNGVYPQTSQGVNVYTKWNDDLGIDTAYFFCYISEVKALYVNIAIYDDSYDILSWRMYDIDDWEADTSINVWSGE